MQNSLVGCSLVGCFLLAAALPLGAQIWDNTGNKLLNGSYYFRELTLTANDAFAVYGNITFSDGSYSINAAAIQASTGSGGPYTTNGTYSISASGFGFINNPLIGSPVYGLVGANGVFVGSITETNVTDIFIAAPITSQGASTLNGAYSISYLQPAVQSGGTPFGALLQMNSNGGGGIGNVNVTAYADTSTPTTQTITGVNYHVSDNAYVVTFPTNNTGLVQGPEFMYSTPDGSVIFGGSPQDFDMLVGVRTGSTGSFGGLYYQAGVEIDESQLANNGSVNFINYYGALNAAKGVILGHRRLQAGSGSGIGYTYSGSYPTGSGGSYTDNNLSAQFVAGSNADAQIGVGLGPFPGISVSVRAHSFSGSGVYIYPTGVVNTASYSPFTAGVSPGGFITIYGSNLGPARLQGASSLPLPTTLDNVKVLINNVPAPISYVSSGQVAVLVPFEITAAVAQIQVINDGRASNVVTEFVNQTTPGVFTQDESGSGYAAALHKDGSLVTKNHPAQAGETVAVYVAGLGTVFPTVPDGGAAPSMPSSTSNMITADLSGTPANVTFAGLAPGFAGLYQVNIQIPSGLTAGDNTVDLIAADSYAAEAVIPVAAPASIADPASSAIPAARRRTPVLPQLWMRRLPLMNLPAAR